MTASSASFATSCGNCAARRSISSDLVITLDGDVEGYLRASEVARDRVEDIRTHLKEGDAVHAMIINIDRKNRSINLSIKAKDHADESEAIQRVSSENQGATTGTTNLGALLRAKMDNKTNE